MATCPVPAQVSEFLRELFDLLNAAQARYCVLHGWDNLPEAIVSDLDLVVHPADRNLLPAVFGALRARGYLPVQLRNYEVEGFRIDFAWQAGRTTQFVGVDFLFEYRYAGLILAPADFLLKDRTWNTRGFWTASPRVEFEYLLMKKALKGSISHAQEARLGFLLGQLGSEQASRLATELFGAASARRVIDACTAGLLSELVPILKRALRYTRLRSRPFDLFRYHAANIVRLCRRWLQPTGFAIIVLGPDGVGKNTLIKGLSQALQPAFRQISFFHWRPGLVRRLKSAGLPVPNPHGRQPHGSIVSVFSLLWFLFDFWLGYAFVVRPQLTRSALVMFNRYYPDLLVDSCRYRYGGPKWLPRSFAPLVPCRDDLVLILHAPSTIIRSRKCEIAAEELERQRRSYLDLARYLHNSRVVDASGAVEDVVAQAAAAAIHHLAERFTRRHSEWLVTPVSDLETHVCARKSA